MTTFAEVQYGAVFSRNGLIYMKTPEINTALGRCDACGIGINAVAIGRQDGAPLTDPAGRPVLPWCVHFCPGLEVEAFVLSKWEVNAQHWLDKLCNTIGDHRKEDRSSPVTCEAATS